MKTSWYYRNKARQLAGQDKRRNEVRQKVFAHLGNKCAITGCTHTDFECDHIDPKTKEFNVLRNWSLKWEKLVVEVDKCQLLCRAHHVQKHGRRPFDPPEWD
jgi:hypothetical protein